MDFNNRDSTAQSSITSQMVNTLNESVRDLNTNIFPGERSIAFESLKDHQRNSMSQLGDQIKVCIESVRDKIGASSVPYTDAQKDAAQMAGIMAGNIEAFRNRTFRDAIPAGTTPKNFVTIEAFAIADAVETRSYAREAYDERDNRSAVAFAITYNLQSTRQDEFGETLYPTITIPADQYGVTITTDLLYVMDNVDHDIGGASYDFKRKNILRAVTDPTVFRKDQTRAMPVYRSQSAAMFVDPAIVPTTTVNFDGTDIVTGPLVFGKQIDLLGISQSDAMIATGVQNQTDTLEPAILLQSLYFSVGAGGTRNVLKFNVENLPLFNFVPSVQGDYKLLTLNSDTSSILLSDVSTRIDGTALVGALAAITTNHYLVRLHLVLSGQARSDQGNISVYAPSVEVYSVHDAVTGTKLSLADSAVAPVVAALNAAVPLGYVPLAYRSNQNRRQQGQFIDVAKKYQRYMIPLRSPITARHPAHIDGMIDASDIQALITATRIRLANEAVTCILQAADLLSSFIDVRDNTNEAPDMLGVGRDFVRPYFIKRDFNALLMIDSIKSSDRAMDIQAGLINELRDMAYLLYRESEYKAASDAYHGGTGPVPLIILATDPYTARYLSVSGDVRTLSTEFQVQVVSTLDIRMRGKIIVAFGTLDPDRNSMINPLNNGNLFWAPELVLTANISRAGSFNRETLVQPRYLFVQHMPVLGLLTVSGIPNVLGKVPVYMADVTVP